MSQIAVNELFEKAALVADLEAVAGVKLRRMGTRWRGKCPLCNNNGKGGSFSADLINKTWFCWSCDRRGGDVIDLEHRLHSTGGERMYDAALRLLNGVVGEIDVQARREEQAALRIEADKAEARTKKRKLDLALSLWRDALPAADTPVETYLRARGLHGEWLRLALTQLRYHPAAYHYGPWSSPTLAPAMIGLLMTPWGPTGGVHVTYLSADGKSKSLHKPSRIMLGPQGREAPDGIVHPGAVWLTSPNGDGPLVVGEGIETTLSAAIEIGVPCRAVATLSLDRLQGGWLRDSRGRTDFADLVPDPMVPAFTWPEPEDKPWGAPIICLDRDMRPIPVRYAGPDDTDIEDMIAGDTRAALCGVLASAAWIRAGAAWVTSVAPMLEDCDFNDQLQHRHAGLISGPGVLSIGLFDKCFPDLMTRCPQPEVVMSPSNAI